MFLRNKNKKSFSGMSIFEYSLLLTALVAALLAVQVSLRRVISAKWKEAADVFGSGRQYESGSTTITTH